VVTATLPSTFTELGIDSRVLDAVARMGIVTPTPIQAQALPALLQGRDLVGQARTGSGKTLAFGIPIVCRCDPANRSVQALVLVPTRELAIQVASVITPLAQARGLSVGLLYGGRSDQPEKRELAQGRHIIIGTPGRTLDHLRGHTLSLTALHIFVLDEADEMLDRGFGPDVERIMSHAPARRQTMLLSATVPDWVNKTAAKTLHNPLMVQVDADQQPPVEIDHVVYEIPDDVKFAALRALLDQQGPDPIIVFGRTKHGVKRLAKQLEALGYSVAALQGNLSQNAREKVMADFRAGAVRIMLATNVAARGLDIEAVEQVINYELPESADLFKHRVGRTGRMGRHGEAVTLVTPDESAKWRLIQRDLGRRIPFARWTLPLPSGSGAQAWADPGVPTTQRRSQPPRVEKSPLRSSTAPQPAAPHTPAAQRAAAPPTGRDVTPGDQPRKRRWFRRTAP